MTDNDPISQDPISQRAPRDSLLLAAELVAEGGRSLGRVRVRNLSATGLMADCDAVVRVGEALRLTLRGTGEIGGTISWVRDGRIGIAFDRAIDPMAARRPVAADPATAPEPAPTGYTPSRFPRTPRRA